ncbi:hypothetical protein [Hyphococcus sp.]|uniref:hypothetical protein n=1 Tax=Hyphococcus sp. TaxID=2038636 RepID=UPI003CCC1E62
MSVRRAHISAIIALSSIAHAPAQADSGFAAGACAFDGLSLYGDVQVVDSFPDIRVQIVESFPDLNVQIVESFPDECGKWKFVESFPDIKIQYVESFPDLKIKMVTSFPGIP